MEIITSINNILGILLCLGVSYQFVYLFLPFFLKRKHRGTEVLHKYAVLIAARNEEEVIGGLIHSIQEQTYPGELVTTFVVADNCSDRTAQVAREAGAVVFIRKNLQRKGKGYALDYLLHCIADSYGSETFDGYFVFDADNLLEENYIKEMNQTFSDGYSIVTSYRNSKNYGDNWVSAGYSLGFLRESQFMNRSRMLIGSSSVVTGTGFLFSREVIRKSGGWQYFSLSEDTEFCAASLLAEERIAYCESAVFYDEQPTSFRQSVQQRMRWARGYMQVLGLYGGQLMKKALRGSFSCFDLLMTNLPAVVLTLAIFIVNIAGLIAALIRGVDLRPVLGLLMNAVSGAFITFLFMGLITTVSQWKQIHCPARKKILYIFSFPIFTLSYIPVVLMAIFRKVEWTPTRHKVAVSVKDVRSKV